MTGGKDDERPPAFADAVDDVTPLRDRDKVAPQPNSTRAPSVRPPDATPRNFIIKRDGDWISARGEDVSSRQLADLRAGRIPADREIDLHGFTPDDAYRHLLDQLSEARRAGNRCLLIIHGWGRRSKEAPVLKEAIAGWLAQPPFGEEVLAFATAPQALGGIGATLVWLRRTRRR